MRRLILIGFILVSFWSGLSAHPVHVSISNFEITGKECTAAVKLFKDDLQLAIFHNYNIEIPLNNLGNDEFSSIILKYLSDNLKLIYRQDKQVKLEYTGNELNDEAIWLYFSAGNLRSFKSLILINTIFLDIFEDQTNLVIINNRGKQEGYCFNLLQTEKEINLDE